MPMPGVADPYTTQGDNLSKRTSRQWTNLAGEQEGGRLHIELACVRAQRSDKTLM